jgi:hypothetical protein
MDNVPKQADRDDRDALIAEICGAFGDIDRRNAISWNECAALDRYESPADCAAARRSDLDTHWRDLIDDATWQPFPGIGGYSFIDARGFRYYLPPAMIRFARGDVSEWYPGHLLHVIERFTDQHPELFTPRMFAAIARFMAFMAAGDTDPEHRKAWRDALNGGWRRRLRAE